MCWLFDLEVWCIEKSAQLRLDIAHGGGGLILTQTPEKNSHPEHDNSAAFAHYCALT